MVALVVLGGVLLSVRLAFPTIRDRVLGDGCTVASYDLDTDQAVVAGQMVGVTIRRNLPERAAVLVLAAGLQESKLRNIPAGQGDRDSVGVLQQRPSQGWGTVAQLSDVRYATGAFLDALVKVPDWQSDSLADVIQSVQVSADGTAYAQHAVEAQALADTFTGVTPAGISCRFATPTQVAPPATVAIQLATDLPVAPPQVGARTVSVPGAHWASVAWFVANADRLGIEKVDYARRQWTRSGGWHDSDADAAAVVATVHT